LPNEQAETAILHVLEGLTFKEMALADQCCGSAGIYSVTEPKLSKQVLARKIEQIKKSGCDTVVTGNPGCILQFRNGLRDAGLPVKVEHPVVLLAKSYKSKE
jgi:glycolate oxidase iron-sulfur subunit